MHLLNAQRLSWMILLSLAGFQVVVAQEPPAKTIRAGMIGLDTSHVPAFTRIFNNPKAAGERRNRIDRTCACGRQHDECQGDFFMASAAVGKEEAADRHR